MGFFQQRDRMNFEKGGSFLQSERVHELFPGVSQDKRIFSMCELEGCFHAYLRVLKSLED